MKIIVNDVAASKGGALSILKDFYRYIAGDKECQKHRWIFLISGDYLESTEHIEVRKLEYVKKSWFHRIAYDFKGVANIVRKEKADYVVSLQNTISQNLSVPQAVYIHQSIPFQNLKKFSFLKSEERIYAVYQYIIGKIIKVSARKADMVIVQTEWMKDAVAKYAHCNKKKIVVAYPSFEKNELLKSSQNGNAKGSYRSFFYPAFDAVYKNQILIDKACMLLKEWNYTEYEVELTVERKYSSRNIYSIGGISHEEVMKRYSKSVLIFPSYIETIGLPLIEAMQQRSIILVADCPYAHETLGVYSNAYYFNPFEPKELATLMKKVLDGKIQYKEDRYVIKEKKSSWNIFIVKILSGE